MKVKQINADLAYMFNTYNDSEIAKRAKLTQSRVWRFRRDVSKITLEALTQLESAGLFDRGQSKMSKGDIEEQKQIKLRDHYNKIKGVTPTPPEVTIKALFDSETIV